MLCKNMSKDIAKIVQTKCRMSSSLEHFAEVQPILSKDSANPMHNTKPLLFFKFKDERTSIFPQAIGGYVWEMLGLHLGRRVFFSYFAVCLPERQHSIA